MKKLFLTLASCFLLFSFGCQENSITEPLSSQIAEKDNSQQNLYHHDFIKLDGILADPSRPFNCCLQIRGQIEYEHRLMFATDPIKTFLSYCVSIKIAIEAELFDPYSQTDPIYTISDVSKDKIETLTEQVHSLTKFYKVRGRKDQMFLVCKFIVTNEDIRLDGMWLKIMKLSSTQNVAQ